MTKHLAALAGLFLLGCAGDVDVARGSACGEAAEEQLGCLAEVGFDAVAGLEVVHVDKASGKDTAVTFTLTGPAEDIDRALTAAGFDAPPSAGAFAFQSDMGVLPGDLADIVSASDVWVDPHDVPFTRQYLRGTLEDGSGDEALAVFAFTM